MLADGSEYRGRYGGERPGARRFSPSTPRGLARAGADLFACETLPCLREAVVLARLLQEFPSVDAWIEFFLRDGEHNSQGEGIADCAAGARGHDQLSALGVNCTAPGYVAELLTRMREEADKPLLAYPNSGEAYDACAKQWRGRPDGLRFSEQVRKWYRGGSAAHRRLLPQHAGGYSRDLRANPLAAELDELTSSMSEELNDPRSGAPASRRTP